MITLKYSKDDLLDEFGAYESEATYTTGNKSTHQMIAMADVEKVIDKIFNTLRNGNREKYFSIEIRENGK